VLWNLVYDGSLMELQDIPRSNVVTFADDLALIPDVASQNEIGVGLGRAMRESLW
jgi:hypothetical protein